MINALITEAVRLRASDIHVETACATAPGARAPAHRR
jgi:type II secretory ATPase GspE/PulE/Tfp pilus assembly ATPase PilB-like protein